jgi:hypothetical protein
MSARLQPPPGTFNADEDAAIELGHCLIHNSDGTLRYVGPLVGSPNPKDGHVTLHPDDFARLGELIARGRH